MPKIFTYNKQEKLKSRKLLEELFAQGNSFVVHPIKVNFLLVENNTFKTSVQIGVGVSKRNFKKATDRNRIKRLIRESYRLHKLPLHQHIKSTNKQIAVFLLYIDKELPQLSTLQIKMPFIIEKLIKQIN
ncbi:MAG: ribonuclease P protein component [Chitinophagaceae bacterium]|nr:ribonuclease P protein component [Chitinophagaceae bacterium]MCW5905192.1 ribonuclease P protein component [Chitinophagaceae bacterium]